MQVRLAVPVLLLPLIAAACATTSTFPAQDTQLRMAQDVPVYFVADDGSAGIPYGCRSPLIDPRDQTRIRMLRSGTVGSRSQGDYEVPDGRYGVGADELLRIDCRTGQVLGIVAN